MAVALDMQSADFDERFAALVAAKRETSADVDLTVADIIDDVRHRGDVALAELSLRFERIEIGRIGLKIAAAEIDAAIGACDRTALDALKLAHARVMDFHLRQKPADLFFTDLLGVELGWRWRPIDAVGLYVPGGAATYPSSVIMNAVPAKVAGCRRLAMVMPTPDGHINPLALAAARIAGVDEIYRVGGAQAIAALAYGTDTIPPVDKIVGPGNAYVAAAKRRVFGVVGIDMIAGPSEVVVLADKSADPRFVAADLLAQAEHDEAAQSILITDDADLARAVETEVDRQLETLPRAKIAGASWRDNGAIILCPSLKAAIPLVDRLAPEHLEIMAHDAEALSDKICQRRRDLPWAPYARSDRRLCRRIEPRPADRALGALLVGLGGARLHEAHVAALNATPARSQRSARRRLRLGKQRGSMRTHTRSRCGFARTVHERETGQEPQSAR